MTRVNVERGSTFVRRADRPLVRVDSADPVERGRQRAIQLGDELGHALGNYLGFFAAAGLSADAVRRGALQTLGSIDAWRPELASELRALARAAALEDWQIAALNARTELLASAPGGRPGECSTLTYRPRILGEQSSPFGLQTWDWTEELNSSWHCQEIRDAGYAYTGITEHGILAKIGMNEKGLGVFLNILSHDEDEPLGVPVHVVVAALLAECASVEEAVAFLKTVPVTSSTALTLVDPTEVACVELSPVGAGVVAPTGTYLAHTNHFLSLPAGRGEKGLYAPDSQARLELMEERIARYPAPAQPSDLLEFLFSGEGEPHLCAVPAADDAAGRRWRTLATVVMEPAARAVHVLDGSPLEHRAREWRTFAVAA